VGTRFSAPVQTGPGAHPDSCTMGTGSFPGVKSGRGVTLTPHRLLVPWSWRGRAIPLLPLWALRPVQSLSACTRVNFTIEDVKTKDFQHQCNEIWYSWPVFDITFSFNCFLHNLSLPSLPWVRNLHFIQ